VSDSRRKNVPEIRSSKNSSSDEEASVKYALKEYAARPDVRVRISTRSEKRLHIGTKHYAATPDRARVAAWVKRQATRGSGGRPQSTVGVFILSELLKPTFHLLIAS
jgi:hypothetical protein